MTAAHQPTERTKGIVQSLASFGIPHVKIADYVGVGTATLHKYYGESLACAQIDKVMKVSETLYMTALNGNVTAMIFFLKTQGSKLGWREEKDAEEMKDEPVSKIQIEVINGHGEKV